MEFIPYGRHTITDEDISMVVSSLKGKCITQGNIVPDFEKQIAKKVLSEHAIATNSATSALHLACLSLDLKEGDILWTSPISFVASANCALYCNAKVDFVDIDSDTGLLSIDKLSYKLKKAERNNCLPKILIPVHLAGSSCDMIEIKKLADKYNFKIIEDASHAIGGKYFNDYVGCCKYSDISVFSFHPVKIITTGEGGMITTNQDSLYHKMIDLRSHGIIKDPERFSQPFEGMWHYEQTQLGFNYRLTDIQAALGLSQLKRLDSIVAERNKQLNIYKDLLKDLPIKFLSTPDGVYSAVHLAIIILDKSRAEEHAKLFNKLRGLNIGVQLHYKPIHTQPYYKLQGFNDDDFPNSLNYSKTAFSIPIFPGLSYKEQLYVCNCLLKILN